MAGQQLERDVAEGAQQLRILKKISVKYYGCLDSNFLEDRGPATKVVATHKA